MDFFSHQERAQSLSRRLLMLFALAVLAIVIAVASFASLLFSNIEDRSQLTAQGYPTWLPVWLMTAAITLIIIVLCAAVRSWQLRAGGSHIAEQLGGTRVPPDTTDSAQRKLYNVIEEIAIASGTPMPAVYVLEQEPGINAFAAGYSASDAAVAVTRGCLEKLSRSELQAVIAHEFSHISHGDMRINVRLIGLLFGILAIALLGRALLHSGTVRGRGRNNKDGAAVLIIGAVLMLLGYIGVFFGRLIKASVSRQREYLADASAVQFTRDPQAIAGALKKIAHLSEGSRLRADGEEVAHMLFGDGVGYARWFATHPPLLARIQRIQPDFTAQDLEHFEPASDAANASLQAQPELGTPLLNALPNPLLAAAHDRQQAMALVIALLAHTAGSSAQPHLAALASCTELASDELQALLKQCAELEAEQHLPLLHLAMPAIKALDSAQQQQLLNATSLLTQSAEPASLLEYGLASTLRSLLVEGQSPATVQAAGTASLTDRKEAVSKLLGVLAYLGQPDAVTAAAAYLRGIREVLPDDIVHYVAPEDWMQSLERALQELDALKPASKRALTQAMRLTVAHDSRVTAGEAEALRVICARLHIPVPHPGAETV